MHCQVINGTPQPPQSLPVTWANVSNFNCLPDAELAKYNWFPFVQTIQPDYNPAIQRISQRLEFDGTKVTGEWDVVAFSDAEKMEYLKQQRAILKSFLDRYMDAQVAPKDYDSVLTACTWITSTIPEWAADAKAASDFRQACFLAAYQIEADVLAGKRPVPNETQFQAEMPVLWAPPTPPATGGNGNGTGSGTLS